tara:strand:- start:152 stop:718 length:567 start_codon:yes stop_codon:yes gene_type:complete
MAEGPMQISFSAPNAGGFLVDVSRFTNGLSDFRPAWPDVFDEIEEIQEDEFAAGGGEHGAHGKWKPLSAGYALWKTEKYSGTQGEHYPKVLSLSGALHESLTGRTGDSIRSGRRGGFTFGTSIDYARHHQKGGGDLPVRRPIDPPRGGIKDPWSIIARAIQRHAVREQRKHLSKFAREQTSQSFGSWG